jgi:hypothetical protein
MGWARTSAVLLGLNPTPASLSLPFSLAESPMTFFFESESSDLVDNQNRIIDDNLSVQLFSACTTFPFLANPCTSNSVQKERSSRSIISIKAKNRNDSFFRKWN